MGRENRLLATFEWLGRVAMQIPVMRKPIRDGSKAFDEFKRDTASLSPKDPAYQKAVEVYNAKLEKINRSY